jgi:tripartite-type tricarboxylate transporter receptor subunit TctC
MLIQKVQEQTGWTIVVENKPGANSILGADTRLARHLTATPF